MSYIALQCRRGMLELDVILDRFYREQYLLLTHDEKFAFEKLLKNEDPILYDWLITELPCTDASLQAIIHRLLKKSAPC